jgi:hypothetical protein
MIAHLQQGKYGEVQILRPETVQLMHGTPLTILPRVNRMVLGFYESNYEGRRMIAHGGDTEWFHSDLNLFLDEGVGLFVSVNSLGKEGAAHPLRSTLLREFADRYFPVPDGKSTPLDEKTAREHAQSFAGHYWNSRRPETNFLSLLNLAGEVKVVANDDGTISVSMLKSPTGTDPLARGRTVRLAQGPRDRLGRGRSEGRPHRALQRRGLRVHHDVRAAPTVEVGHLAPAGGNRCAGHPAGDGARVADQRAGTSLLSRAIDTKRQRREGAASDAPRRRGHRSGLGGLDGLVYG